MFIAHQPKLPEELKIYVIGKYGQQLQVILVNKFFGGKI